MLSKRTSTLCFGVMSLGVVTFMRSVDLRLTSYQIPSLSGALDDSTGSMG